MSLTIEGQIADAILAAAEANKPAVIAVIQSAEGGIESFIATAVKGVKVGGLLGIVWPTIESSIISELVALETANPGAVIFAALDSEAHALAKSLGG